MSGTGTVTANENDTAHDVSGDPVAALMALGAGLIGLAVAAAELERPFTVPRIVRLERRAAAAAASVGRTGPLADKWASDLAYWIDRYLGAVELDAIIGENEPSDQTHHAREYALAMLRVYGVLPLRGLSAPLPVGVVDGDIAAFCGEDAR